MTDGHEYRKALAREVFASIADLPAEAVRLLASGLRFVDGPLSDFWLAFDYYADVLADPSLGGGLATLKMAHSLRVVAMDARCDELTERLEAADVPPWPQLAAALVECGRGAHDHRDARPDRPCAA